VSHVRPLLVHVPQVTRYLHHNGRIILAGDAAHVHSLAGGQGMNTGLQDAANLAWKLSVVVAGEAAAGWQLLETYQEERHPVGAQVVRMSGGDVYVGLFWHVHDDIWFWCLFTIRDKVANEYSSACSAATAEEGRESGNRLRTLLGGCVVCMLSCIGG
jgi:2-polyprenyl-6-methoxyphenol hydroxylase-like FAD-dependent oxidoreductase